MDYVKAFLVGGALCLIGQILIDKTKLTPARILVSYVVAGVLLGAVGLYPKLIEFAGAGASVPLTGFGSLLAKGAQHVGHAGRTAAMIAHVVMIYEFADEDAGIHTAQQVRLQDGGCGNQDRFHH